MLYIAYATKNTPYEHVIKKYLINSLDKLNLKYYVEYPEDFGNWQENTKYKAKFIKECLLKFKESIVCLDADATVLRDPVLFDEIEKSNEDIALHFLDWMKNWRKQENGNKFEALSGTLYIKYNEKTLKFLDLWIDKNNNSGQLEQKNMQDVLESNVLDLKINKLPYSYCVVINRSNQIPSHMIEKKDVIILHHQKSRLYRNRRLWT